MRTFSKDRYLRIVLCMVVRKVFLFVRLTSCIFCYVFPTKDTESFAFVNFIGFEPLCISHLIIFRILNFYDLMFSVNKDYYIYRL